MIAEHGSRRSRISNNINEQPNRSMSTSSKNEQVCCIPELNSREIEILLWVGEGLQNKNIAEQLGLSAKTVEFHKSRLYAKLGVTGAVGAVRFAIREGYMEA